MARRPKSTSISTSKVTANTLNSGSVSRMIQASDSSSRMREPIASDRPSRRARSRFSGGSRPTRIEMKMMLSTPSTISRAVRVARATQALGSAIQSNMLFFFLR